MNNKKKNFLTLILFVSMLSSCYYDKEDLLYGEDLCDSTNVSFSSDIMPIINNSCAVIGCHIQGGSGNGLFENYAQIKTKVENGSLSERVTIQQDMPPSEPLTDCQIEHIMQWIEDGALNN